MPSRMREEYISDLYHDGKTNVRVLRRVKNKRQPTSKLRALRERSISLALVMFSALIPPACRMEADGRRSRDWQTSWQYRYRALRFAK